MIKFDVGQKLFGQGEYELVVFKRTAKTITIQWAVSGRVEIKKVYTSDRGFEYVSLPGYDLRATDTVKKVDQPIQTDHNSHLFFNGVYLDPAIVF